MAGDLTKRVAVAAVGIPLAVVLIYIGGVVLALVLAAVAAHGAAEVYRLAEHSGVRPFVVGARLAALLVLAPIVAGSPLDFAMRLALGATLLFAAIAIFRRGVTGSPLAATAVTVFGALLTGGTLMYAVMLREIAVPSAHPDWLHWVGPAFVALPIRLALLGDTFVYFGGRRFCRL